MPHQTHELPKAGWSTALKTHQRRASPGHRSIQVPKNDVVARYDDDSSDVDSSWFRIPDELHTRLMSQFDEGTTLIDALEHFADWCAQLTSSSHDSCLVPKKGDLSSRAREGRDASVGTQPANDTSTES